MMVIFSNQWQRWIKCYIKEKSQSTKDKTEADINSMSAEAYEEVNVFIKCK